MMTVRTVLARGPAPQSRHRAAASATRVLSLPRPSSLLDAAVSPAPPAHTARRLAGSLSSPVVGSGLASMPRSALPRRKGGRRRRSQPPLGQTAPVGGHGRASLGGRSRRRDTLPAPASLSTTSTLKGDTAGSGRGGEPWAPFPDDETPVEASGSWLQSEGHYGSGSLHGPSWAGDAGTGDGGNGAPGGVAHQHGVPDRWLPSLASGEELTFPGEHPTRPATTVTPWNPQCVA